jgi:hypothetical protein
MKHTINISMSIILPFMLIFAVVVAGTHRVQALEQETLQQNGSFQNIEYKIVDRVTVLQEFFKKYNAPLLPNAETFVQVADLHGIDYRLMPAISCVESTCGKFLLQGSHNPFGWGGGYIYFRSFSEGIVRVGQGLNDIYFSKGLDTPEKIAPVYAPPSRHTWPVKVNYFMDEIGKIQNELY